jgi:dolichyl-phosphate-mannose--protein O-mannosyl transferase
VHASAYDRGVIPAVTHDDEARPTVTVSAEGAGQADPPPGGSGVLRALPEVVRRRLSTLDRWLDPYSWLTAVLLTVLGGILRLVNLGTPKGYVFDEVYYPTDAWDMLQRGIEWDEKNNTPAYVVHPPLGKWMIALGEWVFGNNEVGWRVSGAICGTIMIFILVRVAYRLFRSVVLAGAAGLLLALDGFHLVLSRTSLLDVFLSFFILLTFAAMLLDRDQRRRRWRQGLETGFDPGSVRAAFVPPAGIPWWRLVAGMLLGCAIGVKWSAAFFIPFFAVLVIVWEVQARRSAGARRPVVRGGLSAVGWLVLTGALMVGVYLLTWTGWFLSDDGWDRHWLASEGKSEPFALGAVWNLIHYHEAAFTFHTGLTAKHSYQSWPWQWLLLGRPVLFYWNGEGLQCGAPSCTSSVLLLGTPLLWWSFIPALAALVWFGIARRDWRAWAILVPVIGGLLPWFYYAIAEGRTMFSFYVLPVVPFLILAVVYVLGAIATPPEGMTVEGRRDRQVVGSVVAGLYVLMVAACFAYFYPIFVGDVLPYDGWHRRMWLGPRWI